MNDWSLWIPFGTGITVLGLVLIAVSIAKVNKIRRNKIPQSAIKTHFRHAIILNLIALLMALIGLIMIILGFGD